MGCDIHAYIEYKRKNRDLWMSFGQKINLSRDYSVFARLAGVRNYDGVEPVVPPRGMPRDAAFSSLCDNRLYISDINPYNGDVKCCSSEQAERWVDAGISKYTDESNKFVTHPDWHTHSWLTPEEFEVAINEGAHPAYRAVLAAMRSFESEGYQARLVFWFDN